MYRLLSCRFHGQDDFVIGIIKEEWVNSGKSWHGFGGGSLAQATWADCGMGRLSEPSPRLSNTLPATLNWLYFRKCGAEGQQGPLQEFPLA